MRVLDIDCRRPSGGAEPAVGRIRRGAGWRRIGVVAARQGRLLLCRRRHSVARRAHARVRRRRQRDGVRRRRRTRRSQEARRCDRRRRRHPGGDSGNRGQQRRGDESQLHRARRRRPDGGVRGGAGGRRRLSGCDRLCRGARHGHGARRSHRNRGAAAGDSNQDLQEAILRHRLPEVEHRPSQHHFRASRHDQGGPLRQDRRNSSKSLFRNAQPEDRLRRLALLRAHKAHEMDGSGSAPGGRQRIRHRRDELGNHHRGAAARALRAERQIDARGDRHDQERDGAGGGERASGPAPSREPRREHRRRLPHSGDGPHGLSTCSRCRLREHPGGGRSARIERSQRRRRRAAQRARAAGHLSVSRPGFATHFHGSRALQGGTGLPA